MRWPWGEDPSTTPRHGRPQVDRSRSSEAAMWGLFQSKASKLRDKHFADALHPNDEGAQVIAQEVFLVFSEVQKLDGLG